MPAWVIGGSALLGGGLGYLGAKGQASAAKQAAEEQAAAERYAADLQYKMYQQNFEAMAPWRTAGTGALSQLSGLTGPGGSLMQPFQFNQAQDPSYQWRLGQGLDAMQNSAAARGGFFSGQTGIDLNNYAQGAASQEYGAAFGRDMTQKNNIYNMLSGISGAGQTATQETGQMGMQAATNMGRFATGGAEAFGAGQGGAANAYAGMYTNFGNQLMSGIGTGLNYNMYQQNQKQNQQWQDYMMGGGGGPSPYTYNPSYSGGFGQPYDMSQNPVSYGWGQ